MSVISRALWIAPGAAALALAIALGAATLPRLGHLAHQLAVPAVSAAARPARDQAIIAPRAGGARRGPVAGGRRAGSNRRSSFAAVLLAALLALGTTLLTVTVTVCGRLRGRAGRAYRYYQIHLTGHDEALSEDLIAAVTAMGQVIAELPARRIVRGQGVYGLQLTYDPDRGGELTLLLVCEGRHIRALDAALQIAYPNVRAGFDFVPSHAPFDGVPVVPPCVIRLRKSRDPIYPLVAAAGREQALSPVLEGVAELLHNLGRRASLRFMILPVARTAAYLRSRHRRLERNRRLLAALGSTERSAALEPSADREQARQSIALAERALFYVEVQIAAEERETCNRLVGGLLGSPGMSTLERRPMILRRGLYRRRYPSFTPPLVMRGSRKLMRADELGQLLALPSARLKVPIARIPEPRLPAPPEIAQARPRPIPNPSSDEAELGEQPTTIGSRAGAGQGAQS